MATNDDKDSSIDEDMAFIEGTFRDLITQLADDGEAPELLAWGLSEAMVVLADRVSGHYPERGSELLAPVCERLELHKTVLTKFEDERDREIADGFTGLLNKHPAEGSA